MKGAVGGVKAVCVSATVVTSLGASSVVNNSEETREGHDEAVLKILPGSSSYNPDSGINCRPEQTNVPGNPIVVYW